MVKRKVAKEYKIQSSTLSSLWPNLRSITRKLKTDLHPLIVDIRAAGLFFSSEREFAFCLRRKTESVWSHADGGAKTSV